ncbi:TetR/AcrR family transcriptional regulator [Mangrovicella endophytica]|uniref:TetR/AcrR family transcriptional regulator n=1 Tax=Mangrovicella endophytica TaxID=2066697 RepID=UPI000C9DC4EE|nr:TetR/AcrR family transcriptional regulator [Mangrovicella endophytica]
MTTKPLTKRKRGAPLIAQILDAALAEIARVGPNDLSIDEVAKRANVNKTTIYRRWPSPEALVFAAFEHGSTTAPMPNTGSLRTDVIESLKLMREVCKTPAMLSLARMQLTGEFTGELGAMVRARIECGDCDTLIMFKRALARGELPPSTDIGLVRDVVLGSAQYQLYFRDAMLPDYKLEQIVGMTLAGAGYTPPTADR